MHIAIFMFICIFVHNVRPPLTPTAQLKEDHIISDRNYGYLRKISLSHNFCLPCRSAIPFTPIFRYTDSPVTLVPADNYVRYVTFPVFGMRPLACGPYEVTSFSYDMHDAQTDGKQEFRVGNHTLIPNQDGGMVTLCSVRLIIHLSAMPS